MNPGQTFLESFEKKYIPEPMSGCWLWIGYTNEDGYGLIDVRKMNPRPIMSAYMRAHRFSYEMWRGSIPDGMMVCHHCDNPSCVNPDHLFVGSNRDNHDDSLQKGRAKMPPDKLYDGRPPHSKLTIDQVIGIKNARGTLKEIAARFDVGYTQVYDIRSGKSWSGIGPFIPRKRKPPQDAWHKRKAEIQIAYRARKKARYATAFP